MARMTVEDKLRQQIDRMQANLDSADKKEGEHLLKLMEYAETIQNLGKEIEEKDAAISLANEKASLSDTLLSASGRSLDSAHIELAAERHKFERLRQAMTLALIAVVATALESTEENFIAVPFRLFVDIDQKAQLVRTDNPLNNTVEFSVKM